MAVAFIGAPPQGLPGFRSVLLNISAVRLNANGAQSINGPGWVTIPVPSAAGNGKGSSPGDLQIDLNALQSGAALFNIGGVPTNTYQQAQVVVDPNNPGTIVPSCQSQNSNQEGCASYPIIFTDPLQGVVLPVPNFKISKNATAPLLIQLGLSIDAQPSSTGGFYAVTVAPILANASSFMGSISGSVKTSGTPTGIHILPLTVSAELAGTNTVIESAPVRGGAYTLELPGSPVTGTSYDLFVSGGGSTYAVQPGVNVLPGVSTNQNFSVTAVSLGGFTGKVNDACNGVGISGATIELLAPVTKSIDCTATPSQCVTVATTSADEVGNFPLPGTAQSPSPFTQIPIGNFGFALQFSASGYAPQIHNAELKGTGGQFCDGSFNPKDCSYSLATGYIDGTVALSQAPPPGTSVQVQVFAENQGTNQLVAALPMPLAFLPSGISAPFHLNVPVSGSLQAFDLFAVAIDPFEGAPDPYPGHTIGVVPNIAGPTTGCTSSSVNPVIGPLDCAGHGSISGTVNNPDLGTSVEVVQDSVQILGTAPNLFSSTPGSSNKQYTLCIPPGNYTLERFENGSPTGSSQNVSVPTPAPTSTPCPSTCFSDSAGATCPGQCFATEAAPL